jgi:hypothetical protein
MLKGNPNKGLNTWRGEYPRPAHSARLSKPYLTCLLSWWGHRGPRTRIAVYSPDTPAARTYSEKTFDVVAAAARHHTH